MKILESSKKRNQQSRTPIPTTAMTAKQPSVIYIPTENESELSICKWDYESNEWMAMALPNVEKAELYIFTPSQLAEYKKELLGEFADYLKKHKGIDNHITAEKQVEWFLADYSSCEGLTFKPITEMKTIDESHG